MPIRCSNCHAENLDNAKDCIACGVNLQTLHINPLHLPPNTTLAEGKYKINSTIGSGGFSITYQAINTITSEIIAIKERWPAKNGSRQGKKVLWGIFGQKNYQEAVKKFKLEAELLKKCSHESIVRHYDYFEENNTCYIVMPFINGQSLHTFVEEKGILPDRQIKRYFLQLAAALKEVHSQGILHRDIKPDNIMIEAKEDRAILIDFGIAREFDENETEVYTIAFTHGYAPLEQYASTARRTASADLYSLCASMYYAITVEAPVKAIDRLESIRNKNLDSLQAPSKINPTISTELEEIILKGMEMEAKKRFLNAEQLIEYLSAITPPNILPNTPPNLPISTTPNLPVSNYLNPPISIPPNLPISVISKELIDARDCVRQAKGSQDKLEEATKRYQEIIKSNQDDFNALIELAQVLIHLNRITEAKAYSEKAYQQKPTDGSVNGALGLISCREGEWQAAVKYLEQAAKTTPQKAWIQLNFAWALAKTGNWKQAEDILESALNLNDAHIESNFAFAQGLKTWIAVNQKDWQVAIPAAQQATAKAKSTNFKNARDLQYWVYPCLTIAIDNNLSSNSQELSHCLAEFSSQLPDSAFAEGYKGWQLARQDLKQEALPIFEKAITMNKVPRWALLNLAILYEHNQDIVNAIKTYEQYLKEFSDEPFVLFRLGTLLLKQNQWQKAVEMVEKAAILGWNYNAVEFAFHPTFRTYIY